MQEIVIFDTESTGVSPITDRIVQFSATKTDLNFQQLRKTTFLVNPTIPIPKEASDVHHVTDEMVKDAKPFSNYAKPLHEFFGTSILVGYNHKRFDIPLLYEEFARCGIVWDLSKHKICDPFIIFRNKEKRDLTAALKFYCGLDMEGAHDAGNDVSATIKVLEGQMMYYGIDLDAAIALSGEGGENDVDFDGKIVLNKDGIACYNFGKHKGKPVKSEIGFAQWMLDPSREFSSNTKNVLRSILNSK